METCIVQRRLFSFELDNVTFHRIVVMTELEDTGIKGVIFTFNIVLN